MEAPQRKPDTFDLSARSLDRGSVIMETSGRALVRIGLQNNLSNLQ